MLSALPTDCNDRTPGPVMRTSRPASSPPWHGGYSETHVVARLAGSPRGRYAAWPLFRPDAAAGLGASFALVASPRRGVTEII